MKDETLLSVREYATLMGISHTEVYNRIGNGRIAPQDVILIPKHIIRLKAPKDANLLAGETA